MELLDFARDVLAREKIEYVSVLSLSHCDVVRPYLLERAGISDKGCAIMLAVPYYVAEEGERNLSLYAVPRDYHLYFNELFGRILPLLQEVFPGHIFAGFADHSPIDEIKAAARAGLGVIGKNRLLITEKYSSFVFLGEIVCDMPYDGPCGEINECEKCGLCYSACPVQLDCDRCLSALSQKKGELTEKEAELLLSGGSAWGCDLCQTACPHSKKAKNTEIDFFMKGRLSYITSDIINNMSEGEFEERAYSWRKRKTILRNLHYFETRE